MASSNTAVILLVAVLGGASVAEAIWQTSQFELTNFRGSTALQRNRLSWGAGTLSFSQKCRSCLTLRGGEDDATDVAEATEEDEKPKTLFEKLKANRSLDPSDHETSVHWLLTVILRMYIALGAPLKDKIPGMQELAELPKEEKPLTIAEQQRLEREALRKEQDDELEQAMMEDKIRMEEEETARKKQKAAAKAAKAEAEKNENLLGKYRKRIEAAKKALSPEPADGSGVITLRIRCPDGTSLIRRFSIEQTVESIHHYIDVERFTRAEKAPEADAKLLELSEFEYVLVRQMPRLTLSEKNKLMKDAGLTASSALMVKPVEAEA